MSRPWPTSSHTGPARGTRGPAAAPMNQRAGRGHWPRGRPDAGRGQAAAGSHGGRTGDARPERPGRREEASPLHLAKRTEATLSERRGAGGGVRSRRPHLPHADPPGAGPLAACRPGGPRGRKRGAAPQAQRPTGEGGVFGTPPRGEDSTARGRREPSGASVTATCSPRAAAAGLPALRELGGPRGCHTEPGERHSESKQFNKLASAHARAITPISV